MLDKDHSLKLIKKPEQELPEAAIIRGLSPRDSIGQSLHQTNYVAK